MIRWSETIIVLNVCEKAIHESKINVQSVYDEPLDRSRDLRLWKLRRNNETDSDFFTLGKQKRHLNQIFH